MSTLSSNTIGMTAGSTGLSGALQQPETLAAERSQERRAASLQRNGKRMILAGSVIAVAGVVLYCMACFAGDVNADMGDILLSNSVPFARATLAVLGFGTLVWLAGSFTYLKGVIASDTLSGQE